MLAGVGCGSDPSLPAGGTGPTGSIDLALTLPDGSNLSEVKYEITGTPTPILGVIPVPSPNAMISARILVPAGMNYLLTLSGQSDAGTVCKAQGTFGIVAGQITNLGIVLACHAEDQNGTLIINGQVDQCPKIKDLAATPISVPVGGQVNLTSSATDADGDPLSFSWMATNGTIADPNTANTTFTCGAVGMAQITLTISDGRPACNKVVSLAVDCTTGAPVLTAPVYKVVGHGVSAAEAAKLKAAFNLPELAVDEHGVARFADEDAFLALPMKDLPQGGAQNEEGSPIKFEGFDLDGIRRIRVLDTRSAEALADKALRTSDLLPAGATPISSHTRFEMVGKDGVALADQPIDTTVSFGFRLGDLPMEGPGAKIRVALDGTGRVTQFSYSFRKLELAGEVPIVNKAEALRRCATWTSTPGAEQGRMVQASLAYFAPPLTAQIANIQPSFRCQTFHGNGGVGQVYFVPAGVDARPDPIIEIPLNRTRSPNMAPAAPPTGRGSANPLDLGGSTANLPWDPAAAPAPIKLTSRIDVGSEGTGPCSGLPWTGANIAGFNNRMSLAGVPVQFSWLDANAWENDWKDPSRSGNDSGWVDDVDMAYWQGHGWPGGFSFSGCSAIDDASMTNADALWGNRDSEWISLFTCLVLNYGSSGSYWWQRWGGAFDRLHQINSFDTVSYHSSQHGSIYANYLTKIPWLWWTSAMKVRTAWAYASIDDQPPQVTWATMGVISAGGWVNWNDYFWNQGSVGPDVPASQVTSFWRLSGGS
jgi:hypothetical protein